MKIIAKSGDTKYLIETSEDELANLVGYYWRGSDNCPKFSIGQILKISDMYKQLDALKSHSKQLESAASTLEMIAKNIRMFDPIINPEENK